MTGADVLFTSNTTDYAMQRIGMVRIATPHQLSTDYGSRRRMLARDGSLRSRQRLGPRLHKDGLAQLAVELH